ncbi:unnamed protein product [Allacma fusca]|uniref:XK-related protein n=1 Tax=Allacma fusca TaxID=39272 RepID=A0A8J2K9R4_9HEXA|nr:unnamed protein product [Allacma fusca]
MDCEHCNKNGAEEKCCWLKAVEIFKFKRRVLHSYIIEPIFDMVVSTISVVLDIITLVHYTMKRKWALAILTSIPILLPTTVFTNVYMSDGSKKNTSQKFTRPTKKPLMKGQSSDSMFHLLEERVESAQKLSIFNCIGCLSGTLHSLFHKDRKIRKRGAKLARKSFRRSAKYLFGTLVLRFIAWSWYLKALLFGVKAIRQPKKYMRMKQPDTHWSRELLIRLDFLQAALENAPQCVIQLYTLLTDFSEDSTLGILTLSFSFVDFVRVVTSVFWNINKGPVVAPEGSYGKRLWKLLNISSWVFIYTARCSAVALVIGTAAASNNGIYAVPIVALILHVVLFAKLFSSKQLGQASEKLMVTTFISIFFLPELDSTDVHVLVQFYYAMILLENTIFTVPFRGLDFPGYCLESPITPMSPNVTQVSDELESYGGISLDKMSAVSNRHCYIEPWIIVFLVPAFTITGSVIRLTAYQKMATFRKTLSPKKLDGSKVTMEERVATIYKKKWTTMTVKEMWTGFKRMLKKEEITVPTSNTYQIQTASSDLRSRFQLSQEFIRKSSSVLCLGSYGENTYSTDNGAHVNALCHKCNSHVGVNTFPQNKCCTKVGTTKRLKSIFGPRLSLGSVSDDSNGTNSISRGSDTDISHKQVLETLDVRFLNVETKDGVQVFQTVDI